MAYGPWPCPYCGETPWQNHRGCMERALQERDEARFFARRLLDFIDEGCFRDDLPMGEDDSPEWELWVKSQVVAEVAFQIRQKWPAEQEPADAETRNQPNPRHEDPAR